MTQKNAFHWRAPPQSPTNPLAAMAPQNAYYHRRKAGLTGTRQDPQRGWRNEPCYFVLCGERDRAEMLEAANADPA